MLLLLLPMYSTNVSVIHYCVTLSPKKNCGQRNVLLEMAITMEIEYKKVEKINGFVWIDYTTIPANGQFRDWQNGGQILTYWWFSDFFFWKKRPKIFPTPHGFHLKTFPTPHGCQKLLKLLLTGFFYPWRARELIFSLKKLFPDP